MEDQALATEAVVDTQPTEAINNQPDNSQPTQGGNDKSEKLTKLLEREKRDPDVKFSNDELDILDQYYDGKLKPGKSKPANPTQDKPNEESGESVSEEVDQDIEEKEEPEDAEEKAKSDPDLEAILKEVGAKDVKEVVNKIKDLRKALSGKDAQTVAQLTKETEHLKQLQQNELALWNDFKKGVPQAIAEMERRGLTAPQQSRNQEKNTEALIPRDKFIDPESADLVNGVIGSLREEIASLKSGFNEVKSERERYLNETATQKAEMSVIDEMVNVAQQIPELKDVPNIREAISKHYKTQGQSGIPQLELFNELFEIADKSNTDLINAFYIKKGRDADRLIQEAKSQGVKEVYNQKKTVGLSDAQTGDEGQRQTVKPITEKELEAMERDPSLMPPTWFDENDNPIQARIPKKAWAWFGFK